MSDDRAGFAKALAEHMVRRMPGVREQLRLVRYVFSLLSGKKFTLVADQGVVSREWVFGVRCRNCKAEQTRTVTEHALEDAPDV